jgi:hypothetical protein
MSIETVICSLRLRLTKLRFQISEIFGLSPSNQFCVHPIFLVPFGSSLLNKKTTHFIKVHLVVADTSTRGWNQHGKKKNV